MEDADQQRRISEPAVSRKISDQVLTADTDSFMVGERVWVGGTLPGRIAYIGETKLGAGDWAGVVLDKPVGKTDGTVAGYHYFQCEPKHGVFSRLTRLTRESLGTPERDADSAERALSGSRRTSRSSPAKQLPAAAASRSSPARGSTDPLCICVYMGVHNKCTPPSTRFVSGERPAAALRVGDRVAVASSAGRRLGTLRFLGPTGFADGQWAGVQLDEARGRNDGSVAGTRYFECPPSHGLMAPVHKVTRLAPRPGDPGRRGSHPGFVRHAGPDEDGFF
ncbi:CAP-Gly domain-containing linker protein 1-like [Pollicipes pollicipes]|uniref:CAP-Gly domain-containing linker protein 1-like n=1 Tax=Pollicipes pollicipes TaxID=41117 RepID=UPI001884EBD4|nr:CAP-Gly domain-containing linker protein 1-like [Pollicipes pollicipes]